MMQVQAMTPPRFTKDCRDLVEERKTLAKGRALPRLRKADGQCAHSFEECQAIWKEQFARTEAGVEVTDIQLAQLHAQGESTARRDARFCPDPYEVLSIIRRFKNGKVPVPGQLPVDILKSGGISMATILTPLFVKASWHMQEPLSWKGGLLVPLFKGKGSPSDPSAYRSIFLQDASAKVHHANMRQGLADVWCQEDDLIQFGGKKGCSTDVAHHLLHAHLSWARSTNTSCAILFVDLQSAFYSVLRSSLFAGEFHDDTICYAMRHLGITPDDWHQVRTSVTEDNATAGIDSHQEGILRDMFSGTHFSMQGVAEDTATMRGTRPGDPVADILFNMAFKLVVLDARQRILESANIPCFGSARPSTDVSCAACIPRKGFAEISFVDDIAYAMHSDDANEVVLHLQVISSSLHDAAAARGLKINYQAGKTEAVLKLAGTGSRAVKHRVWHECGGRLPVVTEHGTQMLQIVHSYKHLGSFMQDHAVVQKDMRHRISQARKAFGQLGRQFHGKKSVNDHTKASVFAALVMSRHVYNVHTWAWITDGDLEHWENGIKEQVSKLAKNKIRPIPPFQFTTAELCALLGLYGPCECLHAGRLRYVSRAIRTAPAALWSFLHANEHENSWLPHLMKSYSWMRMHLGARATPAFEDAGSLLQFIAIDQKWNGRVRTALKACLRFQEAGAQGKLWTLRIQAQISRYADVEGLSSKGNELEV